MSAAALQTEPIDWNSLQAVMIRWKLAEQFLSDTPEAIETGRMALHVLIYRDFPALLREVIRLRPDLLEHPDFSPTESQ